MRKQYYQTVTKYICIKYKMLAYFFSSYCLSDGLLELRKAP